MIIPTYYLFSYYVKSTLFLKHMFGIAFSSLTYMLIKKKIDKNQLKGITTFS